jgi:predicted enzyme involved in methoxymalonyl-ACP biosynthesis
LNGHRKTEADWVSYLHSPDTFVMTVSYRDKFGPLGKIAVLAGREAGGQLLLDHWVMSCRAFSRRIEHCSILKLFARFQVREIEFDFAPTSKNAALQQFFKDLTGQDPRPMHRLTHAEFMERCPKLSHKFQEN